MLTIVIVFSTPTLQGTDSPVKIGISIRLSNEIVEIGSRFLVRIPDFTIYHKIVVLAIRTFSCLRTKVFSYLFYQIMQKFSTRTTTAVFQTSDISSSVTTVIRLPVNVQTIIISSYDSIHQRLCIFLNRCNVIFRTLLSTGKAPIFFCSLFYQFIDLFTGGFRVFSLYFL